MSMFSNLFATFLTILFVTGMGYFFNISLKWKRQGQFTALTVYTPTLLTSLGILGTFTGIVAGLLAFDTAQIDQSIGPLLEGLKTAFLTSIVGMLLSIAYKVMIASGRVVAPEEEDAVPDEVTAADLYRVMAEQSSTLNELKTHFCESDSSALDELQRLVQNQTVCLEKIQSAIGGDGESSMVGQFKLMRSDMNDHQRLSHQYMNTLNEGMSSVQTQLAQTNEIAARCEVTFGDAAQTLLTIQAELTKQQSNFADFENGLWQKLQDFADMMSKSATEQVIEALKSVIEDFNNNLTEQFGENFKQLNAAVLELVTWQDNYKQQLGEMKAQYELGVQAITQTEASISQINEDTQSIPQTMDQLSHILEVNQHQIAELSNHLAAFEIMRDKAVEALPQIHEQIDMTLAGTREASESIASGAKEITSAMVQCAELTQTALQEASQQSVNSTQLMQEQLSSGVQQISDEILALVESMKTGTQSINDSYIAAGEQLTTELTASGDAMTNAYKELSKAYIDDTKAMTEQFHESLNEMQTVLANTIHEHAKEHRDQANAVFDGLKKAIIEVMSESTSAIKEQLTLTDEVMGQEIEKVLQAMGGALTAISGQFTKDYGQLVERMQTITRAVA